MAVLRSRAPIFAMPGGQHELPPDLDTVADCYGMHRTAVSSRTHMARQELMFLGLHAIEGALQNYCGGDLIDNLGATLAAGVCFEQRAFGCYR